MAVSGEAFAQPAGLVLRPEDFGARGDGATNDSRAFAALSARMNALGGGTIWLGAGKTYVVGLQAKRPNGPFEPQPLLELANLTRPLAILGNGARLKAAPGLRFGAFDPVHGRPVERSAPNLRLEDRAGAYWGMIYVRNCRAPIVIRDVELDGDMTRLRLGGQWNGPGRQVPGSGLFLRDNLAEEVVENVFSHDHPLDGMIIDGDPRRTARSRLTRVICRSNGRQGASIVGGRGYDFHDCEFSRTGRSVIHSPPAAGVDIEAEGKIIRDLSFTRCTFSDNGGAGMVAETGDSADVRFTECRFVGTTNWSAWPRKPGFTFDRCTFAGAAVNAFSSRDPALATKFIGCRFTDEASLSPTGQLYFSNPAGGPIVELGESENVLFDGCRFELGGKGVLPWCWRATFRDCTMRQASRKTAYTKGRYLGRTVIDGPVDLYGSMIVETVILNGRIMPRGPVGTDFKPW